MSIMTGDCLDVMKEMESNSISAVVTDPPYGLKFMGKQWDHGVPGIPFWQEALRVCKPGSFLLAFGGSRTYHRLTCAIEDAGWEIRDCIQWIYGSGFPKGCNDIGNEGYGTTLKPAYEPIVMAMKPCNGTFKQSAEKWGQAGINIEESRIGIEKRYNSPSGHKVAVYANSFYNCNYKGREAIGRWPSNVILDEEAGEALDEQSGISFSSGGKAGNKKAYSGGFNEKYYENTKPGFQDKGGASRFFYCAKSSPSERGKENNHPTVKPLKLMKYLITLVMPPNDGILLDPFAGSGSTIMAAKDLGHNAIGIEKEEAYAEIARSRIASVAESFRLF